MVSLVIVKLPLVPVPFVRLPVLTQPVASNFVFVVMINGESVIAKLTIEPLAYQLVPDGIGVPKRLLTVNEYCISNGEKVPIDTASNAISLEPPDKYSPA